MRLTKQTRAAVAALAALALVASACGSDDASDVVDSAVDAAEDAADNADEAVDDAMEEGEDAMEDGEDAVDDAMEDGEDAMEDGEGEDGSGDEAIRIGIVAPSAENDLAFTQSIVDSVNRVGEGREIDVQITDGTFVVEDAAAAIRGYADDGVDLVIAHGSQYGAPLEEIAPDFPDTTFAWGTAVDTFGLENVFAYTVRADQGGYVNGVIAAQLTESNTIGVVGPIEVGDAKLYVDGFAAGAEATNSDVSVDVTYIESFSDVALAAEAATAFVENGADVLTGTAQMVVGATGVATDAGVPWFGTQSDQTPLGEDIVVASQQYRWEIVLEQIIGAMADGAAGGETFTLTFENGGLEMIFNDGFELADEVRASADEAIAGLTDGSLSTGIE